MQPVSPAQITKQFEGRLAVCCPLRAQTRKPDAATSMPFGGIAVGIILSPWTRNVIYSARFPKREEPMSLRALLPLIAIAAFSSAQSQPARPAAPAMPPPAIVSPEIGADNRVTFRLRDPNATEVLLGLEGSKPVPMQKDDQERGDIPSGRSIPIFTGIRFSRTAVPW